MAAAPAPTAAGAGFDVIFFDSACTFCERGARSLAMADRGGRRFRFAPLHGATAAALFTPPQRATLPDSIIVCTDHGQVLTQAKAMLYLLRRLGGWRGGLAAILGLVPTGAANRLYAWIARHRQRLFPGRRACRPLPAELRVRFLP